MGRARKIPQFSCGWKLDHYLSSGLALPGFAFALSATARSVGLLAHSLEQLGVAQVIRPRGPYVGVRPGLPRGRAA